nr:hypothetical protein [Tanacetum cinerariifolium]
MVSIDGVGFDWSYVAEEKVPTNMALMDFSDSEIDLSYSGLEKFKQHEFESYGPKSYKIESKNASKDIPNELKESPDAPLVKDMMSDNKDYSVESSIVVKKKTVVPTIDKVEVVRPKQQVKPVMKPVKYTEIYRLTAITIKGKGWVIYNREFSVARTPQQNGVAERKNRTLIEAARPMLADYGSLFDSSSKNTINDKPQPSSDNGNKDDEGVSKDSGIDDQKKPKSSINNVNTVGPSINTASTNLNTGSLNINTVSPTVSTATPEATHADFFGDEPEGDMSNITNSYQVPFTPNTRIHKDHSLDLVICDMQSCVLTRRTTKTINEQGFISAIYEGKTHENLNICLFACFLSQIEPTRVAKALFDPAWGKKAIGTKWVFRNKKDERGIVIKNKARLVAHGYTQEKGIYYDEVFARVARIEAIRLFLAYALFMGFMVYKVMKALYGLHQAPRAWYETLAKYLLGNGFQRGKIDQTLFIKRQKGDILLIQVYVDDIIVGSTKKELCTEFERLIKDKFQMSSMGELTFFLGLQVNQKEDGIFVNQNKYVTAVSRKFHFSDVKSSSTPVDTKKPLVKDADGDDVDMHLYRSMIGSLMYLTTSRPDIMYANATVITVDNREHEITATIDDKDFTVTEAFGTGAGGSPRCQEAMECSIAQTRSERVPTQSDDSPLLRVNTLGSDECSMSLQELTVLCTTLSQKVESLEANLKQTKQVYGSAYTKLIIKVKRLEKTVKTSKARRKANIVVSDDEEEFEDPSKQGRREAHSQEDQPKDQLGIFSAAKVLVDASKVHTYSRKRRAVSTGSGGVSTSSRMISTSKESVSIASASMPVSTVGMIQEVNIAAVKDKGKGMTESEPVQTKTKRQQEQERLGLEVAVRLQEQFDEEERQRMTRVYEAAQTFTEEKWKNIRARVEDDEELNQRLQAEERNKYSEVDQAKMLVDLINQRKRYFAEQKVEAKSKKPMNQAQQRTYMSNYIEHMGSYTLKQLKKLSFDKSRNYLKQQ